MHIALFHNVPSGGAKRAIFEWTRRLTEKHTIDVYSLSTANHSFCDIRPFVNLYQIFDFTPKELFKRPFGRINQLQRWRDLAGLSRLQKSIASELDRHEYDIVFANTCVYTFIPIILQFVHSPSVYYLHEPIGISSNREFQRPYMKQNKLRKMLNKIDPLIIIYQSRRAYFQRQSIFKTKRLLANSRFTKEQMKVEFGLDTPVCHYGVDSSVFRPNAGISKGNIVISVGELTPRKGFDFIVESLALIPMAERPALILACNMIDTYEKAYVQELANKYAVDLRIHKNLNSEELSIQYNKAKLCVYAPILEPFGLVPLEAMSCGIPVVGVDEGGVPESVVHEETGLIVKRDPTLFARAIRHLLSDQTTASHYGQNGREHILTNWTWENSASSLEYYLLTAANTFANNSVSG